ncbi:MAG: NAD-binding protein, partial [Bacteroidales bacterium]|nr:NAD-binding protein [Bacteroidales bacterium]
QLVILSVILVIGLKTVIAGGTGFVLGHTFKGTVLVGLALSQVGEFSFILAKIGLDNFIINEFYYQLFLAVAVITMAFTPFLMKASQPLANIILKLPLPDFLVKGLFPLKELDIPDIENHLVIIGKDSSALKLSKMAKLNNVQHVSVIFDPLIAKEKIEKGEMVVYGDAVNEPILLKAHVDSAETIIISVGDLIPSMAIVDRVRQINKKAHIVVRAKHIENVGVLYKLGADQVFPEKLEIAIDLFNRFLANRLLPQKEINRIITHIRNLSLGEFSGKDSINQPSIIDELPNVNISAIKVETNSKADGHSISEIQLRTKTGVTVLALKRGSEIIDHIENGTTFMSKDIVYVLGNPEQVNLAFEIFTQEK